MVVDFTLYRYFVKDHPYLGKPVVRDFLIANIALKHVITRYLTISDIMNLSETCKYFYAICTSDMIWRYIYEKCFQIHDTFLKENDFFKACQAIYASNSHDLQLQLLVKYGYAPRRWKEARYTGATPKIRIKKEEKVPSDTESEVCLCKNCCPVNLKIRANDSLINLYTEYSPGSVSSSSDEETEVDTATKKLSTSISQIKIIADDDKKTSNCNNDDDDKHVDDDNYHPSSSKNELKRRLALLIKHAMKYPIDCDDGLPGDSGTKYALK